MARWIKVLAPDDFNWGTSLAAELPRWEPTYSPILDHGYVGLLDFMGDDDAIAEAARVSYAKGNKRVRTERGLIRYLMRHAHWTPFEMCEIKFHVKAPILVFRQWHRHRTASINEMSARYSVLDNEMYLPGRAQAAPQSGTNKQGRADGLLSENDYIAVGSAMEEAYDQSYSTYQYLLGFEMQLVDGVEHEVRFNPPDAINQRKLFVEQSALNSILAERKAREKKGETWEPTPEEIEARKQQFYTANGLAVTGPDYPGLTRELARAVLPVATYSQMYWKTNLRNLLGFLKLRQDAHAQYEIRVYAQAMYEQVKDLYPLAIEAYDDYVLNAVTLSAQDQKLLGLLLRSSKTGAGLPDEFVQRVSEEGKKMKMSQREIDDLIKTLRHSKMVAENTYGVA